MHRAVLACLLLTAPAVGCLSGDDGATAGPNTDETADDGAGRLSAPNWSLGDHWTWTTDEEGEVTYVVTGETGGDWIVDTTNRGVAFFDARFDVSTLGEIRKNDLAGSQGDTRVEFFDWPLEANKTWTTTWDGVEREITVDRVENGKAYLTATQEGRLAVEYTYDSQRASFGKLVFYDENGTQRFGMQPRGSGSDFGQPAIRWQLDEAVNEAGTFDTQPASFGFEFEVPENATDLWLDLAIDCPGTGGYSFGFGPNGEGGSEGGSGYEDSDTCPAETALTGPVVEEPAPGEYNGGFTASSAEEGTYGITLFVRTLQEVAVGGG